MSEKVDWSVHPNNPGAQPFNINGKKCQSKTHTRWNPTSSVYFRNQRVKKTKEKNDE